jgi:exodeoxyribonuclease V alpha subunit
MHDSHRRMLQRNLLYTGISRFKRAAIICGQRSAVRKAVENDTEESRNTGLKARMEDTRTVLKGIS